MNAATTKTETQHKAESGKRKAENSQAELEQFFHRLLNALVCEDCPKWMRAVFAYDASEILQALEHALREKGGQA
jgi:hypothetical protein